MRILLVDDSRTMRSIQKTILTQLGYADIHEACDGLDGLSKALAIQPDLLLVDSDMPNMDGVTFVKRYRANGARSAVIMVTTEVEKARVVEAIKAGVNNYVVKPFTPETLGERIKETLARMSPA